MAKLRFDVETRNVATINQTRNRIFRLRFDVETRNVATFPLIKIRKSKLRFDVETRNVATYWAMPSTTFSCGLM